MRLTAAGFRPRAIGSTRLLSCVALVVLLCGAASAQSPEEDAVEAARVEGYASAVIDLTVESAPYRLELREGTLYIWLSDEARRSRIDWDQLSARLVRIDGVERVVIEEEPLSPEDTPSGGGAVALMELWEGSGILFLPRHDLFDPLLADPRWPRFGASILGYLEPRSDSIGNPTFGETVPVLRGPVGGGQLELSLQAGVYSIFKMDESSTPLINTDFQIGGILTWQRDWFTVALRGFHISSHVGDEFLLDNEDFDRINLSYEQVDLYVSLKPTRWGRLYFGGGYHVHRETDDLDRAILQFGAELKSPRAYLDHRIRPVAALNVRLLEESQYDPDVSLVWGLQLENTLPGGIIIQFLGRYYEGRSPDGQFFVDNIEYVGFGMDLYI